MIKLLRLASILVVLCAVGVVVFVVVLGIRGDQQIEEFLNAPNVIDIFRKSAKTAEPSGDQVSPLVKFAKDFALRINPPPPPARKRPKTPSKTPATANTGRPKRPKPKVSVTAKFKVLATCRYEQEPSRSLVLVDRPPKGLKWLQQGEKVGHLTIQEVRDGSVLCSDGQELFVPPSKVKTKTLLKSDLTDSDKARPAVATPPGLEEGLIDMVEELAPKPRPVRERIRPSRRSPFAAPEAGKIDNEPRQRRRVRRLPAPKPKNLAPEQTPEEQSEALTDSIEAIKQIMNQPETEAEGADNSEELKMWEQLLKSLEEEKKENETENE
ncbi:MAG: hypothetical protein ACYTFK_02095 [Planctomycetota bacterium]|jgi:hypothetical protein